jgi:hypothetical protein
MNERHFQEDESFSSSRIIIIDDLQEAKFNATPSQKLNLFYSCQITTMKLTGQSISNRRNSLLIKKL